MGDTSEGWHGAKPYLRRRRRARQRAAAQALRAFLPERAVLWQEEDTRPYECDGLTAYRQLPMVVALPETEEQVQHILRTCHALGAPVVPRGAGTGLSGGALPPGDGVLLSMAKFMRVLRLDPLRASRWCSPACATRLSEWCAFCLYSPDPSSQTRAPRAPSPIIRRRALPQ